tara:strand:+ start:686 stop:1195 length:510 start_codon:yes stop_codon:yes gene_type:complete
MQKVKCFWIDCDGTLTDGHYHVSDNGTLTKSFYTRDFWAIEELLKLGEYKVAIVTQASDNCIDMKCRGLLDRYPKHFFVCKGVEDKYEFISSLFRPYDPYHENACEDWKLVFYIGDAENDVKCIEAAGWSACPADAIPIVKEKVSFVCEQRGGRGAVYEAIMHYLKITE